MGVFQEEELRVQRELLTAEKERAVNALREKLIQVCNMPLNSASHAFTLIAKHVSGVQTEVQ